MNFSTISVDWQQTRKIRSSEEKLGHLVHLLCRTPGYQDVTISSLLGRITAPIELGQFAIFFSPFGRCLGYATWAYLAPDVERRAISSGKIDLKEMEWNEGRSLWLIDFVAINGSGRNCMRYLRDVSLFDSSSVRYVRLKGARATVKEMVRDSKYAFFAEGATLIP